MKVSLLTLALFWGNLHAASIDVSSSTNIVLHAGDKLSFDVFTGSYSTNAQGLGLPVNPSDLLFNLITEALEAPAAFAASIESSDRSFSIEFAGPLLFTAAYLSSSSYSGTVSALTGHLHVSDLDSAQLFHSGRVTLRFLNEGSDVEIGLPPRTLGDDLFVSLSGGPLSVGALPGAVWLDSPFLGPAAIPETPVPEPESPLLFLGGGMVLCTLGHQLRRWSWQKSVKNQ